MKLLLTLGLCLLASACDCRPVVPFNWSDLRIQCNNSSDFAAQGSDQVILDSEEDLERFLRFDCLPGEAFVMPQVDWATRVVIIDVTRSPLANGSCVKDRTVGQVDACFGGIQILYNENVDPECATQQLTGSVSVRREDVRSAFMTEGFGGL